MKQLTRSFLLMLCLVGSVFSDSWRELAPGIDYFDLGASLLNPWSHIHVFRVNLNDNQLELVMADDLARKNASVNEFAAHTNALISINGGFFDRNFHPLGLRISQQQQHNSLKHISWWGIFYIKDKKPYLSSVNRFQKDSQIDFALQSGPRLLIDGKVPNLKPGLAERSALGITSDGHVIILVTDNNPLTTTELANLMKSTPLKCQDALNLDGGSSSQLTAQINSFKINVHGFSNVSDAVVVKARH